MLPKFPEFKKLELGDQADIEAIASKYDPYSDFNFEIMWSWDIADNVQISDLNGNLALIHENFLTGETAYSYLGNHKINDTVRKLFGYLDLHLVKNPQLSLVPEASLRDLDFKTYYIGFDKDSCDYVYILKELADYVGNRFTQKRGRLNNFLRNYPETTLKVLDLQDLKIQKEIFDLNDSWIKSKSNNSNADKELLVIKRFLDAEFKNIYCIGVYDKKKLIGYAILSTHGKDYVVNHFIKGDFSYKGVYEFLMHECAVFFSKKGFQFLNYLEDMGDLGIRQAKLTYRPTTFLKKYSVNKL